MNQEKYEQHTKQLKHIASSLQTTYKVSAGEAVFLGSFLVNFVLGKLIHFTSQKEEVYNYYNDKNNILNQLFVKRGWLWTTVMVAVLYGSVFYAQHPLTRGTNSKKVMARAIVNYLISTLWWIFFTQWCFGVPIMDKIFLWTGGKCVDVPHDKLAQHLQYFTQVEELYQSSIVSSKVCRNLRGKWEGGHDPSGHVFLLIHSSLYLFFELIPFWNGWHVMADNVQKLRRDVSGADAPIARVFQFVTQNPSIPVMALVSLWWFMLLMTNIYFHSILEKLVGLLFGYLIAFKYLVPRFKA